MAVIRIEKNKNYTVMSNYHLRDKNLSLKAKGLLSIMLSLPEGWHYNVRGLASICKEGVTSISSTLKELEEYGYMKRHQPIVDGKFQEIEYIIYETPQVKVEDSDSENADQDPMAAFSPVRASIEHPFADESHSGSTYTDLPCTENLNTGIADTVSSDTDAADTGKPHAYKRKTQRNTKKSSNDVINYPSINHRATGQMDRWTKSGTDPFLQSIGAQQASSTQYDLYQGLIKNNIMYEDLCVSHPHEIRMIDGIIDIMVDAVCSSAPTITIDGQQIPQSVVKSRLLKLNYSNIEYVLTAFSQQDQKIYRLDRYLLTMLYKSSSTEDAFYSNWVRSTQA